LIEATGCIENPLPQGEIDAHAGIQSVHCAGGTNGRHVATSQQPN